MRQKNVSDVKNELMWKMSIGGFQKHTIFIFQENVLMSVQWDAEDSSCFSCLEPGSYSNSSQCMLQSSFDLSVSRILNQFIDQLQIIFLFYFTFFVKQTAPSVSYIRLCTSEMNCLRVWQKCAWIKMIPAWWTNKGNLWWKTVYKLKKTFQALHRQ